MSRTVIKPSMGFHAELPGLDLPTLIQMTCARRERLVVRVSSYGEEGYLYSADGALVHATVGTLTGEEAVLRMLAWPTGEFSLCDRPFPLRPTIETSTEGLLLRAAQRIDEAALERETDLVLGEQLGPDFSLADQLEGRDEDEPTALPTAVYLPYAPLPELTLPRAPSDLDPPPNARRSSIPPPPVTRTSSIPAPPLRRTSSVPPPPPQEALSRSAVATPSAAATPQTWPLPLPTPSMEAPVLAKFLQPRRTSEAEELADATAPKRADATPSVATPRSAATRADATETRPTAPPKLPSLPAHPRDTLPPVSRSRPSEPPPRVELPQPVVHPRDSQPSPTVARRPPPPPPAPARKSSAPGVQDSDSAVLASVRLGPRGEVVGALGSDDQLAQLVAYVSRIAALLQADFSLDPFEAMHAELSGKRVLIFQDGSELVGLVMKPSSQAQELRQRLGV